MRKWLPHKAKVLSSSQVVAINTANGVLTIFSKTVSPKKAGGAQRTLAASCRGIPSIPPRAWAHKSSDQ